MLEGKTFRETWSPWSVSANAEMIAVLVGLFIIYGTSAQLLGLGLNEKCRNDTEPWICKRHYHCESLKKGVEIRKLEICTFVGRDVVICCPPTVKEKTESNNEATTTSSGSLKAPAGGGRKAEEKCREYAQYVYRVIPKPSLLPGDDGYTKIDECAISAQKLIVGGLPAELKEFPHMALIGYGERSKIDWLCGGSLISPKFVLSAAHCTRPNGRLANWVRLGDLDISDDNDGARPINVKILKRTNHPQYSNQLLYHDIALYELESEVKFGAHIRPLCLQSTENIPSKIAIATGWGNTEWDGSRSSILQKTNLTIVSNQKCNRAFGAEKYKEELPNGIDANLMICAAGEKLNDTCQGDSGGPLQIEIKDPYCMYSQIGVISFGQGCALGYPGVYTKVSNYLDWIESIVWS